MGFFGFLSNIFDKAKDGEQIDLSVPVSYSSGVRSFLIDTYAMITAIQTVASLAANCEFKTYWNGMCIKGQEWHRLNIRPNVNQSGTEFWQEFYSKLLYNGEALIFELNGQFVIADSFTKDDYAVKEHIFRNVSRGDFTSYRMFLSSEVFYVQYQNEGARQLKLGLLSRYNELLSAAAEGYEKSGGTKVIVNVPMAARGADTEKELQDLFDVKFDKFFNSRNSALPLSNGITAQIHQITRSGAEIETIEKIVNDAMKRAAQAFKLSPALLTGEIAGIKEALDWTLTVCIDPLTAAVSEEITGAEFTADKVAAGNYIVADTSNIKHIDIFDIAGSVDKLISSGFLSIDEARASAGLQETGEDWAKKHYITKNYQSIDDLNKLSGADGTSGTSGGVGR